MDRSASKFARDARAALADHEARLTREAGTRDTQPALSADDVAGLVGRLHQVSQELQRLSQLFGDNSRDAAIEQEAHKHAVTHLREDHARATRFKSAMEAFLQRNPKVVAAMEKDRDLGAFIQEDGSFHEKLYRAAHLEVASLPQSVERQIVRARDVIASLEESITRTARAHAAHSDLQRLQEAKAKGASLPELLLHLPNETLARLHASSTTAQAHAA